MKPWKRSHLSIGDFNMAIGVSYGEKTSTGTDPITTSVVSAQTIGIQALETNTGVVAVGNASGTFFKIPVPAAGNNPVFELNYGFNPSLILITPAVSGEGVRSFGITE